MNEEKRLENQKEDKKFGKKFAVVLTCSALIGMVCGIAMAMMKESDMTLTFVEAVRKLMGMTAPYVSLIFVIVMVPVLAVIRKKVKDNMASWDGENEQEYEKMDAMLGSVLYVFNISIIIIYFFFAIGFERLWERSRFEEICYLGGFIAAVVLHMEGQKMIVNMIKELNPEKRGSIYDLKFAYKWEESCDEAERSLIYKSAYKTYTKMNTFFVGMWLFCVLGNEVFAFGLVPVTMVSLLWLVQVCLYTYYSKYYTKHPEKR